MNKRFMSILLVLALALPMVSCHRRPLVDMHEKIEIRVKVNIKAISNITENVYNPRIPVPKPSTDMMRVMVYDPESKNLLTQSFIFDKVVDENGEEMLSGKLDINYGNYDFVIYNFDTPTTLVKDENNENKILAYTSEIPPSIRSTYFSTKADDTDYDSMLIDYEPDHLMVAREHDYRISPHDTMVVINTTATTIIDTYYIQIHVENAQYMASDGAMAVITGLSPSNRFGLNLRTEDPSAAVVFDLQKSTDDKLPYANKDVICAVFNTFGKINSESSDLHVTFSVKDVSGKYQTFDTSLNDVFLTEDAIERHWLLVNETFTLVPPVVGPTDGQGGFQPVVDDWEQEEGQITL